MLAHLQETVHRRADRGGVGRVGAEQEQPLPPPLVPQLPPPLHPPRHGGRGARLTMLRLTMRLALGTILGKLRAVRLRLRARADASSWLVTLPGLPCRRVELG